MYTVTISKKLLNSIALPGMGRSIEVNEITGKESLEIRQAFSKGALQVAFEEEPEEFHRVINVWPDPHTLTRLTLFIS